MKKTIKQIDIAIGKANEKQLLAKYNGDEKEVTYFAGQKNGLCLALDFVKQEKTLDKETIIKELTAINNLQDIDELETCLNQFIKELEQGHYNEHND